MSEEEILEEENPMHRIRLEKVIVHISVGSDWDRLQKASSLLKQLTGQKPIFKNAKKTIRTFGITRKHPMATLVTLRGEQAYNFLKKAFEAVDNKIKKMSFDEYGNFAFGIPEHLYLPGTKYDPDIGIFGMDVIVHLSRSGRRVKLRRYRGSKIGKEGLVKKEEAINYIEEEFGVEVI